uniref:VWFD domain-containing protein n=1 Tax=Echeneis naucrates TaxID=173247 RepID=A0A665WE72_ECHNA
MENTPTCSYLLPLLNGETWKPDNCTTAVCKDGHVTNTTKPCSPDPQPICVNGRQPVKVVDDDGCCFHYECECVCSIWGATHYKTFDGKSYSFNENCTFYLVKEINEKYGLTITLNNHNCDPGSTFCPKTLTVKYHSSIVDLTQENTTGTVTNVYVNEKRIYPAYRNSVLSITGTDMSITLEIPEIELTVVYKGSSFSIDLPLSLFEGNTEGQCGTCDNSKNNECRSPNGQIESCSVSAGQWHVPGTPCSKFTTTSPAVTVSTTTSAPSTSPSVCKPAICDVLTSSVFAKCQELVSPEAFVKSCIKDNCENGNKCSSLEAYADECATAGVCIDWRNSTDGQCEHKCPSGKVYKACGPTVEPTLSHLILGYNKKFQTSTNSTKEGCFCPSGTTLFNTVYDICVTSCDCVGPDGRPKQPGDTWTSGCNNCVCDNDTMSIQCEPIECPPTETPPCNEPGQQLVNKTGDCCPKPSCGAENTSSEVNPQPCQDCHCSSEVDPNTKLNIIICKDIVCNKTCPQGYEYQTAHDKCCGTCVQTSCSVTTPDNTTHIVEVSKL